MSRAPTLTPEPTPTDLIARELVGSTTYVYRVAPVLLDGKLRWQIEFKVEREGFQFEPGWMGRYDTLEEALEAFVPRLITINIAGLEALHPAVARGKTARIEARDQALAREKADAEQYQHQRQARVQLDEKLLATKFKVEFTPMQGESGPLPVDKGPSYGGLTITFSGNGKYKRYYVTHQKSGLLVSWNHGSLREAKMYVLRVTGLVDFRQAAEAVSAEVVGNKGVALKRLRLDPWADISDLEVGQ